MRQVPEPASLCEYGRHCVIYDDTLCPDNGGDSGLGYSRLVLPAQLRGPFHVCNWIGLSAPAVRLSDQSRVTCTRPRQRLCDVILPHATTACQGQNQQKGPLTFWVGGPVCLFD